MDKDLPLKDLQAIAGDLFGSLAWTVDGNLAWANMPCPGADHHTKREKNPRACRIYLGGDKAPTIYCSHTSCQGEVAEANFRLRSEIGKVKSEKLKVKNGAESEAKRKAWLKKQERKRALAERPKLQVQSSPRAPGEKFPSSQKSETQAGESRTVRMAGFKEWMEGVAAPAKPVPKAEGGRMKDETLRQAQGRASSTQERSKAVVMTAVFPRSGKIFRSIYQDGQHRLTDYLGEEWKDKAEG